jgi:hypothetical protein
MWSAPDLGAGGISTAEGSEVIGIFNRRANSAKGAKRASDFLALLGNKERQHARRKKWRPW